MQTVIRSSYGWRTLLVRGNIVWKFKFDIHFQVLYKYICFGNACPSHNMPTLVSHFTTVWQYLKESCWVQFGRLLYGLSTPLSFILVILNTGFFPDFHVVHLPYLRPEFIGSHSPDPLVWNHPISLLSPFSSQYFTNKKILREFPQVVPVFTRVDFVYFYILSIVPSLFWFLTNYPDLRTYFLIVRLSTSLNESKNS